MEKRPVFETRLNWSFGPYSSKLFSPGVPTATRARLSDGAAIGAAADGDNTIIESYPVDCSGATGGVAAITVARQPNLGRTKKSEAQSYGTGKAIVPNRPLRLTQNFGSCLFTIHKS